MNGLTDEENAQIAAAVAAWVSESASARRIRALADQAREVLSDLVTHGEDHPDRLTLHVARLLADGVQALEAAAVVAEGGVVERVDEDPWLSHHPDV